MSEILKQQNIRETILENTPSVIESILSTTKEELDSMDLSYYESMSNNIGVPVNWYFGKAGEEHYRLLMKISTLFNGATLFDIGTYQGSSAIALAHNDKNFVMSYDVKQDPLVSNIKKANLNFQFNDVLSTNMEALKHAPFVMLDTYHDGSYENRFYFMLKQNDFRGILLLDDIYLNDAMRNFWDSISETKHDISHIGHHSGTGIVDFSK
jgi:hypothetical protein